MYELLGLFSASPSLFSAKAEKAKPYRDRLMSLVEQERQNSSRDDLRAVFALKLILSCPELLEIKGKRGFEWIADEFMDLLLREAVGQRYGARQGIFYTTPERSTRKQKPVKNRTALTFLNLLKLAQEDLGKAGRPTELLRDLRRSFLYKIAQRVLGLPPIAAVRYAAGIEGVRKAGSEAAGKRIRINLGTDERPNFLYLGNVATNAESSASATNEIFTPDHHAPSEREMFRSLQNVKKRGLEWLDIPAKQKDEKAEWQGVMIPVQVAQKSVVNMEEIQERVEKSVLNDKKTTKKTRLGN